MAVDSTAVGGVVQAVKINKETKIKTMTRFIK
jgi:hypothetical protein